MKRSEINSAIQRSKDIFERHGWALPPNPRWDVTDFGLGDFEKCGLVLVNLAEQKEYCEKLMCVQKDQLTPMHCHAQKKEDIICRFGKLAIRFDVDTPNVKLQVNNDWDLVPADKPLVLASGERVTLTPGLKHEFWAESDYAVVGEVSTANDDVSDNYFKNEDVGRFSQIVEDEAPVVKLVSDG